MAFKPPGKTKSNKVACLEWGRLDPFNPDRIQLEQNLANTGRQIEAEIKTAQDQISHWKTDIASKACADDKQKVHSYLHPVADMTPTVDPPLDYAGLLEKVAALRLQETKSFRRRAASPIDDDRGAKRRRVSDTTTNNGGGSRSTQNTSHRDERPTERISAVPQTSDFVAQQLATPKASENGQFGRSGSSHITLGSGSSVLDIGQSGRDQVLQARPGPPCPPGRATTPCSKDAVTALSKTPIKSHAPLAPLRSLSSGPAAPAKKSTPPAQQPGETPRRTLEFNSISATRYKSPPSRSASMGAPATTAKHRVPATIVKPFSVLPDREHRASSQSILPGSTQQSPRTTPLPERRASQDTGAAVGQAKTALPRRETRSRAPRAPTIMGDPMLTPIADLASARQRYIPMVTVPVQGKTGVTWRDPSAVKPELVEILAREFYNAINDTEKRKQWARYKPGEASCVLSYVVGRGAYKSTFPGAFRACDYCTRLNRPCVKIISMNGVDALGFHPLPSAIRKTNNHLALGFFVNSK
ncbi:hypothetical protein HBI56_020680 [Parastagonospora nodorum]|uniref:Uncharacterized protein n=1 Tax=Phaeosphaeria nodorum (strain SN15 / ATCC MYA-4574 / FGSC 10173) TaxID=321614 RepID=A0A7U2F0J0_PHANO|nr:hypothetical protein HBH56_173650 [Parastagonospora nodorum]QRC96407.1 hypothetical protein JI435_013260 [Parastagonospora nodorum SN15]KAH3926427.1 hypothetical protein HBH54_169450 [Parastagonospora nodorum]KAH3982450.1 hypothetical protein HBH52_074910 [Parastagonospora nodorum]KAH4007944.1 hypothetical protein HBI10_007670 [Parastagonospora nodorum]